MIHEIIAGISLFFQNLIYMLSFGLISLSGEVEDSSKLRIYIKHYVHGPGESLPLDLDPSWSIYKIKEILGPKLGLGADEIKIIFSGKELSDSLIIEECNLGQQSFLHAVQIHRKDDPVTTPKSKSSDLHRAGVLANAVVSPGSDDSSFPASSPDAEFINSLSLPPPQNFDDSLTNNSTSDIEISTSPIPATSRSVKSSFYVYCNSCQSLEEGKLRVRCGKCLSGAFLVLRDPENWDDVLIPNRVPGSCETPNCDNYFAQFYFRCTAHITEGELDQSPPLPSIKSNSHSVSCLACGDVKNPVFVFECEDTHVTCIDCFQQYILVKLNERQFVEDPNIGYTVGCPALCPNSFVKYVHHFKLLGKQQYDRYQRFATEEFVLASGGVFCPQPNCGMAIIPMDNNCNKIACTYGCEFVFCRRCLEGWHTGTCSKETSSTGASSFQDVYPVSSDRAKSSQFDAATKKTVRLTTKPCPSCRIPTERSGGCMHMECTRCRFEWCWVCQVVWSRDCQGNHWFG